jgi:hypothetical protein
MAETKEKNRMVFDRGKIALYQIFTDKGKIGETTDFFEALLGLSLAYAAMKYRLRGKKNYPKIRMAARNFYLIIIYKIGGASRWRLYYAWRYIATNQERNLVEHKIILKRRAERNRGIARRARKKSLRPLF